MKKFLVFLCATMLVFSVAGMANATLINVISNGSFENPEVTYACHVQQFESIPSWSLGDGNVVEIQRTPLLGWTAADGDQWVELDANPTDSTLLSQGFATESNKYYTVTFAYSARPDWGIGGIESSILDFGVIDSSDSPIFTDSILVDTAAWQYYSYNFMATDESYSISFEDTGVSDGWGIFLDALSVVDPPPGAPVPEPATMLLLGTGLIGLASLGRKRFFKK